MVGLENDKPFDEFLVGFFFVEGEEADNTEETEEEKTLVELAVCNVNFAEDGGELKESWEELDTSCLGFFVSLTFSLLFVLPPPASVSLAANTMLNARRNCSRMARHLSRLAALIASTRKENKGKRGWSNRVKNYIFVPK